MTLITCALALTSETLLISEETETVTSKAIHQQISSDPFVISAEKVKDLSSRYGIEIEELLHLLVPIAGSYAHPAISNYYVGAAALGKSGAIYLGANLEFSGATLHETVHAEQFAIANARGHGETELTAIAISAEPCGHCRQFMKEMGGIENFQIMITNSSAIPFSSLLPRAFGPENLGFSGNLLSAATNDAAATPQQDSLLKTKALEAARASYAPYSHAKSGVAIQTKNGAIYSGAYLENVAYNPSLSPLQSALVLLVADLHDFSDIQEVVLVEQHSAKINQAIMTRELLKIIAPLATFTIEKLEY